MSERSQERRRPFNRDDAERLRKGALASFKAGKGLSDLSLDQLLVLYADVSNELVGRDTNNARVARGQLQSVSRRLLGRE